MSYALILCGSAIRYPRRDAPGDRPRGLLLLNNETIVGRLVRQARQRAMYPVLVVGRLGQGGWLDWHMDAFGRFGCDLIETPKMKASYFMPPTRVLLEHVIDLGIKNDEKAILIPGDFVFTEETLNKTLAFPPPCLWCWNDTDPGISLNGATIPAFLELVREYEDFEWPKVWFEYAGLWKKERARMKAMGFRYFGKLRGKEPKNDPSRFVEVDVPADLELAKELVRRERASRV